MISNCLDTNLDSHIPCLWLVGMKSLLNGNNVQGACCSFTSSWLYIQHKRYMYMYGVPFNIGGQIFDHTHGQSYEGKHHLCCTFMGVEFVLSFCQSTVNKRGRGFLLLLNGFCESMYRYRIYYQIPQTEEMGEVTSYTVTVMVVGTTFTSAEAALFIIVGGITSTAFPDPQNSGDTITSSSESVPTELYHRSLRDEGSYTSVTPLKQG